MLDERAVGELTQEDYDLWLAADVKQEAIRLAPHAYSATEVEHALMVFRRLRDRIERDYGLDPTRNWYSANRKLCYADYD